MARGSSIWAPCCFDLQPHWSYKFSVYHQGVAALTHGTARRSRTYVLIAEDGGHDSAVDRMLDGFVSYVLRHGDRSIDRVLIAAPSPRQIPQLEQIWSDWPHLEIQQVSTTSGGSNEGTHIYFSAAGSPSSFDLFTRDMQVLRRHLPNFTPSRVSVPTCSVSAFLGRTADQSTIALLALNASTESLAWVNDALTSHVPVEALSLEINGADLELVAALDKKIRGLGYLRSGRAWGPAGSSCLYRRSSGVPSILTSATKEGIVTIGRTLQRTKSLLPARTDLHAAWDQVKVMLDPRFEQADVLDSGHGRVILPLSAVDVDRLARRFESGTKHEFGLSLSGEFPPLDLAHDCQDRHGVWPISFSYPSPWQDCARLPIEVLSPIVPGFPYSFVDHDEYMGCYNSAALGITHRKAGWDCFRHVEILASGSIPLMIDADDIPRYSMIHYPKRALAQVANQAINHGGVPDESTRLAFQSHFEENLTTLAMARYLLRVTGHQSAESVLFVDQQHPGISDYQSTLALIGLKEIYGAACRPLYPVPWIYEDWQGETSHLYGRGFGYTRVLAPEARSAAETACLASGDPVITSAQPCDVVVVGSISRNLIQAGELLKECPPSRTIWIHGEDTPPRVDTVRMLRSSGTQILVRSIGTR